MNTKIALLIGSGAMLTNFAPHLSSIAAAVTYAGLGYILVSLAYDITSALRGRNEL